MIEIPDNDTLPSWLSMKKWENALERCFLIKCSQTWEESQEPVQVRIGGNCGDALESF